MLIDNLSPDDAPAIEQAAQLLVDGFREHWPKAWPTLADALEEVREALAPERICRVARDESGALLGWVAAIPEYDGNAWELHPLVVRADQRRRGIGYALVADLERQVAAQGGVTLYLGSDDESGLTSLANTDLYPDVWAHIATIRNLGGHPYSFYQRCGFVIVGVIPDANGPGRPDILMAKRVGA
jgi:aminoglycoside 6'-N-acetyltransferase I